MGSQISLLNLKKEIGELCHCGCGQLAQPGRKFVWGHHMRDRGKIQRRLKGEKVTGKLRDLTTSEKTLLAYRLFFPKREDQEDIGDYLPRKFFYFVETYCKHVSGEYGGKPIHLMSWQQDIFKKLFGTLDENGRRIYRWLHIFIGRKNGKSLMVVLLILYWLCELSFEDPGTEIYGGSSTREQASKIIFRTARMMVENSPELRQLLKVGRVPAHITNRLTGGFFEPVSSDGPKQLGKNASLVIIDEAATQPSSELWDALSTSQGARAEPLFCSLSTAGSTRACFFYSIYEKMKEVQKDQTVDPSTLVAIFEVDEADDWRDPRVFLKANPACGTESEPGFRSRKEIELLRKAALEGEGESAYQQFYLNRWSAHGERKFVYLGDWDNCKVEEFDIPDPKTCRVVGGVDLSSTVDLSAFSVIIEPPLGSKVWSVMSWAFLAGRSISECERRDKLPYGKWLNQGVLIFDGQPTIQISSVFEILRDVRATFPQFSKIGYDPYLGDLLKPIAKFFQLIPVPQQYSFLSPGLKLLKSKILERTLAHNGDPLLRASIENARVLTDPSGNTRLDKSRSMTRIDPLVSLNIASVIAQKEDFRR